MLSSVLHGVLAMVSSALHGFLVILHLVTWRVILMYSCVAFITYLVYITVIRHLLSPLRKIPGLPFIPVIGNTRITKGGDYMEPALKMMKTFGKMWRFYYLCEEMLCITDPDIMKHVFVTNSKNYIKPTERLTILRAMMGDGLVMSEGMKHAVHKRLISPAFRRSSIITMLPIFVDVGDKLTKLWKMTIGFKQSSDIVVHEDLSKWSLDVIGKTAFGYEFNALEVESPVIKAFKNIVGKTRFSWHSFFSLYYHLPFPGNLKFKHDLNTMRKIVNSVIAKKRKVILQENKTGELDCWVTGDVLGQMMLARDDTGRGMTNLELEDEVMTLMLAGFETTSTGMAWLLLSLAQHSDIQEKARVEIISVCNDSSQTVTYDMLQRLPFCDRVIKESLRLHPPVGVTMRQAVGPDVLMDKYHIPKGTTLLMAFYAMMRDPEIFPEPNTFNPDRFLEKSTNDYLYSYLPFSVGHRMCIGNEFAKLQMKTLLTLLLKTFRFQTIPGTHYTAALRTTMPPSPSLELKVSLV